MIHITSDAREGGTNEHVSGGSAHLERILTMQQEGGVRLAMVNFEDGAITHWHTHPGEQILYITAGECRFGNEAGETFIARVGDAIYIPPGEKHWHGATAGNSMSHLSVTTVGGPTWMEPVENPGI
ncbi:MAG: cupin domain-containing protein [Chloroflexota bacterium]